MQWFEAERLPLSIDLEPVLRSLQLANIPCWISEDAGEQIVWLQSQAHREQLTLALQAHREQLTLALQAHREQLTLALQARHDGNHQLPTVVEIGDVPDRPFNWRGIPVTFVAIGLSVLGALLIYIDVNLQWVHWLTFTDVLVRGNSLYFTDINFVLKRYEYWRFFTPMFLHFGPFHILFNSLWIWDMGRRIECRLGSHSLLVITLCTAVAANLLQYVMSGPSLFGGMSGVVYGYLGYIWMWQKFHPSADLGVPSWVIGFMLLWLVLCFTGVIDRFIDGQIANGAHLGGLLCGICMGLLSVITRKLNLKNSKQN